MELVSEAIAFAVKAHDGMRRKKSETPYILHPMEAAVIVGTMTSDQNLISAAALHDVVEDSDWTFEMLKGEGFSDDVIDALKCVTKLSEDEDYDHFIDRILGNQLAVKVKLNDLEDNLDLSRLANPSEKDVVRSKKYMRARARLKDALNES